MMIAFPSREFDDVVAAACHGTASDEEMQALHRVLHDNAAARDEYILRVELHSRLATEPDLFELNSVVAASSRSETFTSFQPTPQSKPQKLAWIVALAACLALAVIGGMALLNRGGRTGKTSKAVAMLNQSVDARWNRKSESPKLGAPLEPGWLRLEKGYAQIVFYSGARVVIEGPAEFQILSARQAFCKSGHAIAEVPREARGFQINTPAMNLTSGEGPAVGAFGINVTQKRSDLHVFRGSVQTRNRGATIQTVRERSGIAIEDSGGFLSFPCNPGAFASLFQMQAKSVAAQARCYERWRTSNVDLNRDPSLLLHFNFENVAPLNSQLRISGSTNAVVADATLVGGQWTEGRWPGKRALEFQNVNDRMRVSIPGEFESVTLTAWVRVQGLDRKFNSLFMTDGFDPGTVHWLIREDGVLSFTIKGQGKGNFQIIASPPVLTLNQIGLWTHLAVVLDGKARRAVHYINGVPIAEKDVKLGPPYHFGAAELGNWNAKDFAGDDPTLIRNFSGAMDEFHVFGRALRASEIRSLYSAGKPQAEP